MKKKICVFATILILVILAFIGFFVWNQQFSLTINGIHIDKEEFLNAASLRKYEVTNYFSGKGGGSVDSGFWEREIDGELPYEKLADAAIEELKYFHAVYGLAAEKGYIEDESYQAFLERFEAENQSRKEKIENGEVVYGLSEFTLELYREYEMDALQKRYCEDLENEGMDITDADREQYYKEHEENYVQEDDRILDYIKIPYEEEGMNEEEIKERKDCLTAIYKKMDKENSLADLAEAEESVSSYLNHADVTAADLKLYTRSISDVLEYAWDLQAGESTAVIDEYGCLYLIECTDRNANDMTSVDEVKDNINKTLRENKYDEIIAERAAEAAIECNMERIYHFMKKNVNK